MADLSQSLHKLVTLMGDSVEAGTLQFGSFNAGGLAVATYDFAVNGGAVGDIALSLVLPNKALILDGMVYVETACTSGGSATVALKLQSGADIMAATAVASLTTNALINVVPVGTAATALRLTAQRTLTVTVGTAALTAGKLHAFLRYVQIPS